MGGQIIYDILGIACGHVYYYLEDVFPNVEGGFRLVQFLSVRNGPNIESLFFSFRILVTPQFMKQIFDPREGRNQVNAQNEAGNGPGGFDWGDEQQQ